MHIFPRPWLESYHSPIMCVQTCGKSLSMHFCNISMRYIDNCKYWYIELKVNLPPWTRPWVLSYCSCAFWWGVLSLSEGKESRELPTAPKLSAELSAFLLEINSVKGNRFLQIISLKLRRTTCAKEPLTSYYSAGARFLGLGLRSLE